MSEDIRISLYEADRVRNDYPELLAIDEFKNLSSSQLRLCWLIGNRTSPIFNIDNTRDRVRRALEMVYGLEHIKNDDKLQVMYELENGKADIPEEIFNGIEKMNQYIVEYRVKAKLIAQYMFDQLNVLVSSNQNISTMDMDEKKKYADLLIKASSELPEMLRKMENGYGVKVQRKSTNKEVKVTINNI